MKFFDFFAGIGGFRLGMEMAGHECVGHCEIDKYANASYTAMHHPKESEVFFDDVRTVNPTDMPECECYCGGFPCQSFSIAGKRGGFEDTRGTLFFEIMRLVKIRHPKYLLLENVKGLLNHDGGRTFETIIRTMDELGYLVEWQVFNSKYFGVPQNRERVYIIGHFRGKPGCQILPITENGKTVARTEGYQVFTANTLAAGDRVTAGTYPLSNGGFLKVNGYHKKENTIKQVGQLYGTEREPNPLAGRVYSSDGIGPALKTCSGGNQMPIITVKQATKSGHATVKPGGVVNVAYPESNTRRGRVIDGGETAPTLDTTTQAAVVDIGGEGLRIRKLTPRECFRLQGFPDEYFDRASAVCSDSQLYKQAGNAVTVNVVYEIAKRLEGGNQ